MTRIAQEIAQPAYAAFISYRHLPEDAAVAQAVQRAIEGFRLPRGVRGHAGGTSRLGKCFRDEDELAASPSLPDSIHRALEKSRTLILICSPVTSESDWVRREVQTFEKLHGRDRIICVLASGTSETSIPSYLRTRMMPDAHSVLREMPAEPLAADLRPESRAKRKAEMLRVIAAVAGCDFDDLRQRVATRTKRRVALTAIAAALLATAITALAAKAHHATQDALAAESRSLAAASQEHLSQGERMQAIEAALRALPASSDDHSRPLVPEAQRALEEALEINPATDRNVWRPLFAFDAETALTQMAVSWEGEWAAALEENGTVAFVDTAFGREISRFDLTSLCAEGFAFNAADWKITAAGPRKLMVANRWGEGAVACIEAETSSVLWQEEDNPAYAMAAAPDGESCVLLNVSEEGAVLAGLVNTETGEAVDWLESPAGVVPNELESFQECLYDPESSTAYLAREDWVLLFNFEAQAVGALEVGELLVSSVAAQDGLIACGALGYNGNPEAPWKDAPYTFAAFDLRKDPSKPVWEIGATMSSSTSGAPREASGFLGLPTVRGRAAIGEASALVCTAGQHLLVVSCETGEELFGQEFAGSIVDAGIMEGIEGDSIALVLSDGTLDLRQPLYPESRNTTVYRRTLPYAIAEAEIKPSTRTSPDCLVLLRTTDPGNRLLCYRFDVSFASDEPEQNSLDELIAEAESVLAAAGPQE